MSIGILRRCGTPKYWPIWLKLHHWTWNKPNNGKMYGFKLSLRRSKKWTSLLHIHELYGPKTSHLSCLRSWTTKKKTMGIALQFCIVPFWSLILLKLDGDQLEIFWSISVFVTSLRDDFGRKVLNATKLLKFQFQSKLQIKHTKTRIITIPITILLFSKFECWYTKFPKIYFCRKNRLFYPKFWEL